MFCFYKFQTTCIVINVNNDYDFIISLVFSVLFVIHNKTYLMIITASAVLNNVIKTKSKNGPHV